jgi:hypothetical protein
LAELENEYDPLNSVISDTTTEREPALTEEASVVYLFNI